MYYRDKWAWRKALLVLFCRIRTVLDDAIIEEETDVLPVEEDEGAGGGGNEPSPQGD
jgi:hypothetical protein